MRFQRYTIACLFFLAVSQVRAQDPPPNTARPAPEPTPEQQRQKQIRIFDPLDKSDPTGAATNPADTRLPGDPDPPTPQDVNQTSPRSTTPLPGSAAESNQLSPINPRRQGPQVISGDSDQAVQEYTGPAVLSRSYTIARPMVPRQVKWTPTVGFSAVHDSGLTGGMVKPDGTLANVSSIGEFVTWGFTGRHFWKKDQIGVDYGGNYSHYASQSSYSGANEFLNLDYGHEFSRHLIFNLIETGSITSQSYALLDSNAMTGGSIANINIAASPTTQILDQGTKQFTSMADMTWKKSARLSFNYGGGYFAVVRTGNLFGNTGYQARADINYRYTRQVTVGLYYSYSNYLFAQHVEASNTHTLGGIFSYAFNRSTQLRLRAGATRVESLGLTTVVIDPVIAALIGRGTAIVDEYRLSVLSDVSAELVKDFGRHRTANLSYARGVAPGNGLLLTSSQETESAAFTTMLMRRYTANFTAGRTSLSSAGQTVGKYATNYASFSAGRSLGRNLSSSFQIDFRRFQLSTEPVVHSQLRISAGLSWTGKEGTGR